MYVNQGWLYKDKYGDFYYGGVRLRVIYQHWHKDVFLTRETIFHLRVLSPCSYIRRNTELVRYSAVMNVIYSQWWNHCSGEHSNGESLCGNGFRWKVHEAHVNTSAGGWNYTVADEMGSLGVRAWSVKGAGSRKFPISWQRWARSLRYHTRWVYIAVRNVREICIS